MSRFSSRLASRKSPYGVPLFVAFFVTKVEAIVGHIFSALLFYEEL